MKNQLITLLAATTLATSALAIPTVAAEPLPMDEVFDDYCTDYSVQKTKIADCFTAVANAIGDSYIKVTEDAENANLFLESKGFTNIYSTIPLTSGYTFSMEIIQCKNSVVFLRAPNISSAAYYEDAGNYQVCRTGIVRSFPNSGTMTLSVRSVDASATGTYGFKRNNFDIALPKGVNFISKKYYTDLYVEDTGTEMKIYGMVNNPDVHKSAIVGWATRTSTIVVDNVYLSDAPEAYTPPAETTPETDPVSDPETDPATGDPAVTGSHRAVRDRRPHRRYRRPRL